MKKEAAKYYIFLLLTLIFVAPGITAYFFYQHASWVGSAGVNKGILLNPPVVLNAIKGEPKWRIIFWNPSICNKKCLNQLDTLARMRLALGRKLYQVDQWLILSDKAPSISLETQLALKGMDFKIAQLSTAEINAQAALLAEPKVFLADPNDYLILSYPFKVNPDDIYKDLRLLLNTTEIKNG